jgi:hypothetical protein
MVKKSKIKNIVAVVSIIKEIGEDKYATVEEMNFETGKKRAFRFKRDESMKIKRGDVITFDGTICFVLKRNKIEVNEYFHKPFDGSSKSDWMFFDVENAKYRVLGNYDSINSAMMMREFCNNIIQNGVKPLSAALALENTKYLTSSLKNFTKEKSVRYVNLLD